MKFTSTVVPSYSQIINILKENGYSEKKIESLMKKGRQAFGAFIKNDDMLAMMVAKNLGVEIKVKETNSKEKLSKDDKNKTWNEYLEIRKCNMKVEGKVSEVFIKKWIKLMSKDKELKKLMVK